MICYKECFYKVGTDCKVLVWEGCSERMECIEELDSEED